MARPLRPFWLRFRPARTAHAHSGVNSYGIAEIDGTSVTGTVQFTVADLNDVMGLDLPSDEAGAARALATHRDVIQSYIDAHFTLSGPDRTWPAVFDGHRILEREAFTYLIFPYRIAPPPPSAPEHLTVTFSAIVAERPDHEALVIVRTSAGIGPLRTRHEQQFVSTGGVITHHVTVAEQSLVNDAIGAVTWVRDQAKEYVRRARKRLRG
jgi:hypothetical protein